MASSFDLPPELWRIVLDHLSHDSNWFNLNLRHHREFSLVSRQFRELGKPYVFRSIRISSGSPLINGNFNNLLQFLKLSPDIAKHVWGLSLLGHSDEMFEMFISTGWLILDVLAEIIRVLPGLQKLYLYELALVSTSTSPFPAPIPYLAELSLDLGVDHDAKTFDSEAICFPATVLRLLSLFGGIGNLIVSSLKNESCNCDGSLNAGSKVTEESLNKILQLHHLQPLSIKAINIRYLTGPFLKAWFPRLLATSPTLHQSLSSITIKLHPSHEHIQYSDLLQRYAPYIQHFELSCSVEEIRFQTEEAASHTEAMAANLAKCVRLQSLTLRFSTTTTENDTLCLPTAWNIIMLVLSNANLVDLHTLYLHFQVWWPVGYSSELGQDLYTQEKGQRHFTRHVDWGKLRGILKKCPSLRTFNVVAQNHMLRPTPSSGIFYGAAAKELQEWDESGRVRCIWSND